MNGLSLFGPWFVLCGGGDSDGGSSASMSEEMTPDLVPVCSSPSPIASSSIGERDGVKIPITILTGFLGAGKSTLLSRLIRERHGWRVAIIMNELGPSAEVDRAIIHEKVTTIDRNSEWLQLENGCLCCTAKNETFLALEALLKRRPDIEHVVVEASGAADPASLVQHLWVDEALESALALDGIICVVDASTVSEHLSPKSLHYAVEAARQVALADTILLNKIDLVTLIELEEANLLLTAINPLAKIVHTRFSDAPLKDVLLLRKYNEAPAKREDPTELLARALSISLTPHSSTRVIRSFTIHLRGTLVHEHFERWLFTLLWERRVANYHIKDTDTIMRIKGVLSLLRREGQTAGVPASPKYYYLQVVQEKYELEPFTNQESTRDAAIIFIGRVGEDTEEIIKTSIHALSFYHDA